MIASIPLLLVLLLWGTVVGLDVVTVPQSMISRPLVAGTVTGVLVELVIPEVPLDGIGVGMLVGAVLELYALDVLPFGAARYPDYGPATVSAVYAALGWNLDAGLGGATAVGLLIAVLGGWTMQMVRRANAAAIQKKSAALAAGDTGAIRALQLGGIRRDIARSALVTACGLLLSMVIWPLLPPGSVDFRWLTVVAVGGAVAAAVGGAIRSAGRTRRLVWVMAGLAGGVLIVGLR